MIERAVEAMLVGHCLATGVPIERVISLMAEATLAEARRLNLARVAVRYGGVENLSEIALEDLLIVMDINFRDAGREEAALLRATQGAIEDIVDHIIMEDVLSGISPN
jgi:hypothetical protein